MKRRTKVYDASHCFQPRLPEPLHIRADRWIARNWKWLLPVALALMAFMKWGLYPEVRP